MKPSETPQQRPIDFPRTCTRWHHACAQSIAMCDIRTLPSDILQLVLKNVDIFEIVAYSCRDMLVTLSKRLSAQRQVHFHRCLQSIHVELRKFDFGDDSELTALIETASVCTGHGAKDFASQLRGAADINTPPGKRKLLQFAASLERGRRFEKDLET
jgi:hypothetical protein